MLEDEEEGSEDGDKRVESESVGGMNSGRLGEGEEGLERHRTVLEDVDGELEMEDVSPTGDAEVFASKERERLLEERYLEDGRSNPGQPPLPPGPPPSVPSPPPLPADPPPSPPPPPRSPPPALGEAEAAYAKAGIAMSQSGAHCGDGSSQQRSDSPSTATGQAGQQGQGNVGVSQVSGGAAWLAMY